MYSDPGFMHFVRPMFMQPRHSWICPCIPNRGWYFSIMARTDFEPTGNITGRPPSVTGRKSLSSGAWSICDSKGGQCRQKKAIFTFLTLGTVSPVSPSIPPPNILEGCSKGSGLTNRAGSFMFAVESDDGFLCEVHTGCS